MRDLFRLVAVALMSFAVVGFAMLYSRGGDVRTTFEAVSQSVTGLAADASQAISGGGDVPEESAVTGHPLSVPRPNAARWAGLAGFPDQSEVSFPLPRGGDYLSGTLNLVFDAQLTEHGDGLMTLSVNGSQRGQVVLDAGRATHQVQIELTPSDLVGDRVVLHMAGRGTTNSGQMCPTDAANSGSAVTLSAQSRLDLVASQPLADPLARLAAAPQPFVLTAPQLEDKAMAVWANQYLNRFGMASRIGTVGSGETPITVSALGAISVAGVAEENRLVGQGAVQQLVAATGAVLPPLAWPVSVADLGAETTVKTFRSTRRWQVPFRAADLPGGALPEQFNLRLKTTPLAGDNDWVVRVSLNGNLVETRRFAGNVDTIVLDMALPPERMEPANTLVVDLVDTSPGIGTCPRPPEAQAQLLPESGLVDLAAATDGWAGLIESLARAPEITLSVASGLADTQLGQASDMLSGLLPRQARMRFEGNTGTRLIVSERAGLAQALSGIAVTDAVKVIVPARRATGALGPDVLTLPSVELGTALEGLKQDDVVIIAISR